MTVTILFWILVFELHIFEVVQKVWLPRVTWLALDHIYEDWSGSAWSVFVGRLKRSSTLVSETFIRTWPHWIMTWLDICSRVADYRTRRKPPRTKHCDLAYEIFWIYMFIIDPAVNIAQMPISPNTNSKQRILAGIYRCYLLKRRQMSLNNKGPHLTKQVITWSNIHHFLAVSSSSTAASSSVKRRCSCKCWRWWRSSRRRS